MEATGRPTPATFRYEAIKNNIKSKDAGHDVFDQVEWIEFVQPGGHLWGRKVQQKDIDERPVAYEKFKAKEEQPLDGMPLENWPILNVAQVAELKHLGVKTVEQLADYPDSSIQVLGMGGKTLRNKAQAFLKAAADSSYVMKLTGDLEIVKADRDALQKQVKELQKKFDELEKEKKGKKK